MKIFVVFHARRNGWKDLMREKQAYMFTKASQDDNFKKYLLTSYLQVKANIWEKFLINFRLSIYIRVKFSPPHKNGKKLRGSKR